LRRLGDLSYGVYIIHFPIIQAAVAIGAFDRFPPGAVMACVAVTFIGAALMWWMVERPALRSDSAYRVL
jgi:peptidoglycan/LPS O-acetylase OafA/YrhL